MASITSAQTGLASATSTWVGGVVPVLGDKVTIAAGHVVTVDGTYSWGDDTTTALNINGTLAFSRTVSTQLTLRGLWVWGAAGKWDQGSEADPIPPNITSVFRPNDSAVLANGKYAAVVGSATGNRFSAWGAEKTKYTQTADTVIAGGSVFPIGPTAGWAVGDIVFFGPASDSASPASGGQTRAVTAVSVNSITVGAGLAEDSAMGRYIANLSRNVAVKPVVPTTVSLGAALNFVECGNVEFVNAGYNTSSVNAQSGLAFSAPPGRCNAKGLSVHNVLSVGGTNVLTVATTAAAIGASLGCEMSDITVHMAGAGSLSRGLGLIGGAKITRPIIGMCGTPTGPVGPTVNAASVTDILCLAVSAATASFWSGFNSSNITVSTEFTGGSFLGGGRVLGVVTSLAAAAGFVARGLDFGSVNGVASQADSFVFSSNIYYDFTLDSCSFPPQTSVSRTASNLSGISSSSQLVIYNRDNSPVVQERYTYGGQQYRDNSVRLRGTSSVRFDCWYAANPMTYSIPVKVAAGQTITVRGSMRVSATYGAATPPLVTLTGLGITPVVAIGPTAADAWQDYSITATNPNSYPGEFTLTYTGQSAANSTGAYCWFDGVPDSPWVDSVRHYGYVWDTNPYRVSDPRITLTEAAALALPVVVDHVAQTITIASTLTPREVFEAAIADLAQTANQGRAVHITSATGDTFATTYAVTGTINGPYTDATGLHVTISAPNLIAQTRVQLLDVGTGTEIHNAQMTADGFSLPLVWAADRTIRLRAGYAEGAVAKMPIEAVGVLTSSGLTFLDAQVDDVAYNAIGLDGGEMAEFAPDYPNLAINVTDPDGVTSVQRLYAWAAWSQTSELGIRLMFRAVQASDTANFQIDQSLVDAKLVNANTAPVMMVGGYLTRKDGSTVIAASSGSIQMDPGKAYVAAGNAAEVWAYASRTLTNGQLLLGSGERVLTLAGGEFVARE